MLPERYRLAAVGRFLLEQFELRLPGLRAWTPEVEASFAAQADAELRRMEQQAHELDVGGTPEDWQRLRGALSSVLLPRWASLARAQIELAQRDYGVWRGGDLVARGVFALAGFVLGIVIVEVPYIPITVKWFPTVTALLAPLLPDAWVWWCQRRHRGRLEALVRDLAAAEQQLDSYRPLSELAPGLRATSASAEPSSDISVPPARERS